ncbi:MAG: SDR family oxidoreductase [Caulobacteraceae bacterium]|nr:SDR family oxidoreductase [Caulobacteraceae bacterium]
MTDASTNAGRAVLVTGGARRIGAAIVRRFAAEGWRCVIHHRASHDEAEALRAEIEAAGGAARLARFDLADPKAAEDGLAEAFRAEPGLAVLVNSASVFEYDEALAPSPQVWSDALTVNSLTPVTLAAAFHRLSPAEARGCVVNILDQKLNNLNPDYFSYTVSKAALQAASQIMARAFAPRTRVVNIAPGLILPSADQTDAEFARSAVMNVLERRTTAEEVADGVYFAATSPYLTGQTLYVDSGQSLAAHPRDVMFIVREEGGA